MKFNSSGDADPPDGAGSACVVSAFKFPGFLNGGGGREKSIADCDANPRKGGSLSMSVTLLLFVDTTFGDAS